MRVLVIGGAGYIGSHMLRDLAQQDIPAAALDDLSTGHRPAVGDAPLTIGSIADPAALDRAFETARPNVVMHFAAKSIVPESVQDPAGYYATNLAGTMELLAAMRRHAVDKLIFSSTAAVYGIPSAVPIDEGQPTQPISPYGRTKYFMEQMIADYAQAYGLRSISLRYFNAAGAHPAGDIGESHSPETHLIPNILKSVGTGGPALKLFGTEHPTPDGSCVRDYIHVQDLAAAHRRAAERLDELLAGGSEIFNLGLGRGYSVLEVLAACERVLGQNIPRSIEPARAGDPPTLVADASRARSALNWHCEHSDLDNIIRTAWGWHRRQRY